MSTTFQTHDVDEASAALSQGYGSVTITSSDAHPSLSLVQHQLGRVRLDRIAYRMSFDASAPPMGVLLVGRVTEGRVTYHTHGGDRLYAPGDVVVLAHPEDPAVASVRDRLTVDVAVLDPTLLGEVAEAAPGEAPPVRLAAHRPVSPEAAARWWRTYDLVRDAVDQPGPPAAAGPGEDLLRAQAARLLVAATLLAFPHTGVTEPDAVDRHDAHPASLRRAVAFIESHPDRDLAPADIARAAGVSLRAVQLTFSRHLGTTPMGYLRRVRLEAARDQLRAAAPGDLTVAEVAARWGFFNFGRFAALYRAEFGEVPSRTLAR